MTTQPAPEPPNNAATMRPPTGTKSWALGFLAFIPIPFLNYVITGIVMASVYPSTRRTGDPVATENARNAANWGLTALTITVLSVGYTLIFALISPDVGEGFFPIGIGVVVYLLLSIPHLTLIIIGTVKASQGKAFRSKLAIPFFKEK